MLLKKQFILISLATLNFCVPGFNLLAQPSENKTLPVEIYQLKYPDENAVCLYNAENFVITYGVTGRPIVEKNTIEDLLLLKSEACNFYSVRTINYSHFNPLDMVEAYTLVPSKNNYNRQPVQHYSDKKSMDNSIFYDDAMQRSLLFPALQVGARTVMKYQSTISDLHMLPPFYFSTFAPTEESACSFEIPKSIQISWKLFNVDDSKLTFTKTDKGSSIEYKWTMKNVPAEVIEEGAINFRNYLPHIIVYINSYTIENRTNDVLNNLNGLYKWYYQFVENLNKDSDQEMKTLVDSLTKSCHTDEEKVKSIYYWVQDQIQYLAFEDGLEGFIPRNASLVFNRRYGDCKDMASIITCMLKYAGIQSYITWIGTRDLPYSYSDVPTPLSDNHMIACYISDSTINFLDGTADDLPFGYASSFILGKEALISIDSVNYKIAEVDVPSFEKSFEKDSLLIQIDGNNIKGNGNSCYFGYNKHFLSYDIRAGKSTDLNSLFKEKLKFGNNKFLVDSVSLSGMDDRNIPLNASYSFQISDYVTNSGDEKYINLQLNKLWYNHFIDTVIYKQPRYNDYPYFHQTKVVLQIPKGYHLEYLPQNMDALFSDFGSSFSYAVSGDKLILTQFVFIDFLKLNASEFENWNYMIKKLSAADNELVILKKN